jgi:hypothetical protein
LERIVAVPGAEIRGQVVRGDAAPLAGARVMFVNTDRHEPRSTVDTDAAGQFRVTLTSGGWLIYLQPADGKPIFQRRIEVRDNEPHEIQLVSR